MPRNDKKPKHEVKADSLEQQGYEKLFKEKHTVAKGMITLHLLKGKLYFEMPLSLLGREMLIGSTVSETSDNGNAIVGSKPTAPLHVCFSKTEKNVQLRALSSDYITDDPKSGIAGAIEKSNIGAIVKNMKIEAWSPDSSALVFDMTDYFVDNNKKMLPFDAFSYYTMAGLTRKESFEKDKSFIDTVKAFDDNVVIRSTLSYKYSLFDKDNRNILPDEPFTAVLTRSILLLPAEPCRPRIGDSRMSVFPTAKYLLESEGTGVKRVYYSNRWSLVPKDTAAYARGEKVEPVKPIVFYVDTLFPESWKPAIKEGIAQWNEMFETVGFKNTVIVKDFPADDPAFDPDNIKYSCVRYAPITIANAMGPSWTDPRSGEILTASVYVYHDIAKLLRNWIFVQTSQTDPRARNIRLPEPLFYDGLRYVISHEVGHCLGFMHNMSASWQIPVDSLRSPSYTQKYGTTTSIMDYARFNYVAQPEDYARGVKLTPPRFGVYDQYAVKWLYTYFPGASAREEKDILLRWLQEASKNPVYRYGKQLNRVIDPRAQTEDLGDDAVKASRYGIANLQYILSNLNAWTASRDSDLEFRSEIYETLLMQYLIYINHVYSNIGGLYLQDVVPGDTGIPVRAVPKERQRAALQFLCGQIDGLQWMDNPELTATLPIMGSAAQVMENAIANAIIQAPFKTMPYGSIDAAHNYSFEQSMADVFDFVWEEKGGLSQTRIKMQENYVKMLVLQSGVAKKVSAQPRSAALTPDPAQIPPRTISIPEWELRKPRRYRQTGETIPATAGYGGYRSIYLLHPNNTSSVLYHYLLRSQNLIKRRAKTAGGEAGAHYRYLRQYISNALATR